MNQRDTEQIGGLLFKKMWSKPDLSVADEIIDSEYHPNWI